MKSSSLEICRHQASLVPNVVQRKGSEDSTPLRRTWFCRTIFDNFTLPLVLALLAALSLSAAHSQQIQKVPTRISLNASTIEGPTRTRATFTAQVASTETGAALPTGSVSFMHGEQSIGAAFLDSEGRATYTAAALPAGEQKVTAVYEGDGNFEASNSAPAVVN